MDAGPERPAETPRSSASAEGFDEVCDAPVGGIGTGIRMVISRFCGSFPEPVSKLMSSNRCARHSKSLPVLRDRFRIISEATVSRLGICQPSPLLDATGASKFWGKDGNRDRPPERSERAFQGSERGEYTSRLLWVSRGTFRGELSADRSIGGEAGGGQTSGQPPESTRGLRSELLI